MDSGLNGTACRLCGRKALTFSFRSNGQDLFRCSNCSYLQISRRPSPNELDAIYGRSYFVSSKYRDLSTLGRENWRRLNLMARFIPERNAVVLDAGCATGDFIACAMNGYQMFGCDVSEFAVAEARRRFPSLVERIKVVQLDSGQAPSGLYDAICLWDVIEPLLEIDY